MSGLELFQRAEMLYAQGNVKETFEMYQKSIKKFLKDGNPTAIFPSSSGFPDDLPRETLGIVWRNFLGFFRDPAMSFTAESHPEAYKLLNSFRPGTSNRIYARLERTDRGKLLLKAMQITAGTTLGLMAWDKRDRATAAKRYKEALDLAKTHPPFIASTPGTVGLEKYVSSDLKDTRDNLDIILYNDVMNDAIHSVVQPDSDLPQRKQVVDLPPSAGMLRLDKTGQASIESSVIFATDACGKCGKRDVKLMRCSLCKKMPCELSPGLRTPLSLIMGRF